jgi:phospholipase/lecithinase/hemolysin
LVAKKIENKMNILPKILITTIISSAFLITHKVIAQNYTEIYVFGDSLSDTGNLLQKIKGKSLEKKVSLPFANCDGRFSNGLLWVENLANGLGLTPNPKTNFAIIGAQSGIFNTFVNENPPYTLEILGLLGQVKNNISVPIDPKALYILLGGANDYLDESSASVEPQKLITDTVTNITDSILLLTNAGAKNILIGNLPNLGEIPIAVANPKISEPLQLLSQNHNEALAKAVDSLNNRLDDDINIQVLDLSSLFKNVINNSQKFGLTNVKEGCLLVKCENPDEFLFWDEIHPTARGHEIISNFALKLISPTKSNLDITSSPKSLKCKMMNK